MKSISRRKIILYILGIIAGVFLTWPFLVGRLLFKVECRYLAGVHLNGEIDARNEGFFDRRLFQQRDLYGVSSNNFWIDVDDLVAGRFSYFEVHHSVSGRGLDVYPVPKYPQYERFFLAESGSDKCVEESNSLLLKARAIALPAGKCLALEKTDNIKSRYEIKVFGYHHTDSRALTKIIDTVDRKTVAKFWSFNLFNPLNFVGGRDGVCPRYADREFSPHKILVSLVFLDRNGKTVSLKKYEKIT